MTVCLSVRQHISRNKRSIFTRFFVHVTHVRGFVVLWRRCDTSCTSGLWMTSYLNILTSNRRHSRDPVRSSTDLTPWRILKLAHKEAAADGGEVCYLRLSCCVARSKTTTAQRAASAHVMIEVRFYVPLHTN